MLVESLPLVLDIQSRWLCRYGSLRDGDVRLICVPCAGHGTSMFYAWPSHLPRQIEIWGLQPPGRENRLDEVAIADVRTLVSEAAAALDPWLDDRPFALLGHSMGALIAFELARELRRRGRPQPRRLFVSGHAAPDAGPGGPARYHLPDAMFVRAVSALNPASMPDAEYLDAIRFMLPTLRADFRLCECYDYVDEPPLACDLSVWGGDDDQEASATRLAEWRDQTTGRFSLRVFPGDHFFLKTHKRAVLQALADDLAPLLGRAGAGGDAGR